MPKKGEILPFSEFIKKAPPGVKVYEETYTGVRNKVKIFHPQLGEMWITASNLKNARFAHKKAQQNIEGKLTEEAINSKLLHGVKIKYETYTTKKHKATFVDPDFGEFEMVVAKAMVGGKHPKRRQKRSVSAEYIQNKLPPHITLDTSTYKNTRTKARFIDSEYGEWWAIPSAVLCGKDHPKRGNLKISQSKTIPASEIQQRLKEQGRTYITLDTSTYKNTKTKARFIDAEYGEWWSTPNNVLHGSDHPRRGSLKKSRSIAIPAPEIQQRLKEQGRTYITLDASTYKNTYTKARFVDLEHGEWWSTPDNVLHGSDHPLRFANRSKNEDEIYRWLKDDLKLNVLSNYRLKAGDQTFEIDMYLPDYKLGVEYHGLYWHSSDCKDKTYHLDKRKFCNSQDIQLIQIYEDEWRDKPEMVKSIVKAKLGLNTQKYYARKLNLKEVNSKEAQEFLRLNHLMGEYKSAKGLGLYTKDGELVSFISYKKHKDGIDISRFCNKLNTNVTGGLSKFIKEITLQHPETKFIQSWVDLRYGTGESLVKLGFKHVKTTLGWKWTDGTCTYNRLRCRANMDERKLSEAEHAEELKWYRIYDAGQALFVKDIWQ